MPDLFRCLSLLIALMLLSPVFLLAEAPEAEPAALRVSGYGFFGNRELKELLELIRPEEPRGILDANFVEDAALILFSRVTGDGYLRPGIMVEIEFEDGSEAAYAWRAPILEEPLPRPFRARRVHFNVDRGVLFHFRDIEFEGLNSVDEDDARRFFIESGGLLPLRTPRTYTPARLEQGVGNLAETLMREGYENPRVRVARLDIDEFSGRVDAVIAVEAGRRSFVRSVRRELFVEGEPDPISVEMLHPNVPYSSLWEQDHAQEVRTNYYQLGYPDVSVEVRVTARETDGELAHVDAVTLIRPGPHVTVGAVRFEGHERTRESVMRRRVRLRPAEPLDRIAAERGRYRLARLGVFDRVELRYDNVDETTRDVVYVMEEGRRMDVSFLAGYGSFELLRAGVELEQYNVFGRAHHSRLRLLQSFRSSSADYIYTMPELVGEDVQVFFTGSGLLRRELEFTRKELMVGAGARRHFSSILSDITLRYNYQVLQASRTEIDLREGLARATVGSVSLDLRHDRRDNPLYPREGYKVFANFEVASELLAGEVNYQRIEINTAYHWALFEATWLHFGLLHGVILTPGSPARDLPFNKRFFPGGEGTVRGFQSGEAAPRNEEGRLVGAESYVLANIELEQGLTGNWSIVGFVDTLGAAKDVQDYPFRGILISAGGGIRWRTLIGPVRLEYGHNLNPRANDPRGTLHFSIGFPF